MLDVVDDALLGDLMSSQDTVDDNDLYDTQYSVGDETFEDVDTRRQSFILPEGMDVNGTLKYIFKHCCAYGKSSAAGADEKRIDNNNFIKMVKKAPDLLTKRVTVQQIDVVFAKCRPIGERRLDYSRFLDALLEMAMVRYPDEDPVTAFTYLLSRHIFGLLTESEDPDGSSSGQVKIELLSPPKLTLSQLASVTRDAELAEIGSDPGSPRSSSTGVAIEIERRRTQGRIAVAKKKWKKKKASIFHQETHR